jgi:heme/copper-type cytochrome/quinol oxidase subunit 2
MEAFTIPQPLLESIDYNDLTQEQAEQIRTMIEDGTLFNALLFMVIIFLIVDLTVRVYVGFSARAIGLQKKNRNGKEKNGIVWLIFGVILAGFSVYSLGVTISDTSEILRVHSIMYYLVSLFVDVTSIFVTTEVVIAGFRLRGLVKKQENMEEVRNAA